MSHQLTDEQIIDAKKNFGIDKIICLADVNAELSLICSQIPADAEMETIKKISSKVVLEAIKQKTDYFYCIGQFAFALWANLYASRLAVMEGEYNFIKITCIESTTIRQAIESKMEDGSIVKTSTFRHVRWRVVL
jgi:hypothetical protein